MYYNNVGEKNRSTKNLCFLKKIPENFIVNQQKYVLFPYKWDITKKLSILFESLKIQLVL